MPFGESSVIQIIIAGVVVLSGAYGSGRIHQWFRHAMDRDEAFREGYDHASLSLFHLATRKRPQDSRDENRR